MPRSIHVLWLSLAAAGCAQPSQSPAVVTAPSASGTVASAAPGPVTTTPTPVVVSAAPSETAPPPAASPEAGPSGPGPSGSAVAPQYRACQSDGDCITVPRAGCCNNGWKEAVAASQKDAYQQAYGCKSARRPICPMYMVKDTHIAKCDAQAHLCVLVQP
jgi:hypothetical protein